MRQYDAAPFPGYPVESGILLATLQDGTREWREELGDVDADLVVWQPYPKGYSIGGLLLHMAEAEAYWIEQVSLGRELPADEWKLYMSQEIDQDNGIWPTPPHEPIAYFYEILDRLRARTLESVRHFEEPTSVRQHHADTVTLRWILAHVAEHDSYHGGQAVMLKEIAQRLRG